MGRRETDISYARRPQFRGHITDSCPYDPPQTYSLYSLSTVFNAAAHSEAVYIGGLFAVARAAAIDEATRARLAAAEAVV